MIEFLFLDMDDTILDFHKAEGIALRKTLQSFGLTPTQAVCARYSQINREHWQRLENRGLPLYDPASEAGDVFRELREFCRGKTVSIVGHFRGAEQLVDCREIRIFEREPREGDYPDAAEEYLIPGSDVVIVTGMAFTNKTMPRLMELSKGAFLALTGPTVPMTEALYDFGVSAMYGMTVWDLPGCRDAILSGDKKSIWNHVGKAIMEK